jgi:hypothetical protein
VPACAAPLVRMHANEGEVISPDGILVNLYGK